MQAMSERPHPLPRAHFPRFLTLGTRWMDNDVHVDVDRASRRPVPLPEAMRAALAPLESRP
jgi:hypothetical protein